jgi:hypothetical protein
LTKLAFYRTLYTTWIVEDILEDFICVVAKDISAWTLGVPHEYTLSPKEGGEAWSLPDIMFSSPK